MIQHEIEEIQIVASNHVWERAKTLKLPIWLRAILFLGGCLSLGVGILGWIIGKILSFFDLITGFWIRSLHRFCHRYKRRLRWMIALSVSAIFAGPHPKMAMAFIMSYCYLYSHDAPEKWINWLSKLS